MKKYIKENGFSLIACLWSLLTMLMWLAMRVNYAGISKALGADKIDFSETINPTTFNSFIIMYIPVIMLVVMILAFIYSLFVLFYFKNKKKLPIIISLILSFIFTGLIAGVIYGGSKDYLGFILPKFFRSLAVSVVIILFAFILFFPLEGKRSIVTKVAIMIIVITTAIVVGYDLKGERFTYDSVVYAVEDEYQIVYSTSDNSIAWVTVGDKDYYDLYAGSMRSVDLVHKISVPQSELDRVGSYTIHAKQIAYRGPFGILYAKEIEKEHEFKGVDITDGLTYYAISDVHESYKGAVSAVKNAGSIDFLVVCGDMCSDVEDLYYTNYTNLICSKATSGSIPVIYARGNHECKGLYSEDLYKYVGSKDQKFYYEFTLSNKEIHGVVLDLGEDHAESDREWWEYSGTDQYNLYRDEQTKLLESLDASTLSEYKYNLVISHLPLVFVNDRRDHEYYKNRWTEILNALPIDACLYGHQHELVPYVPGEITPNEPIYYNNNWYKKQGKKYWDSSTELFAYMTDFNFYGFMVGRCLDSQMGNTKDHGTKEYTGLLISINSSFTTQTAKWINSKGEVVPVMSMFVSDKEASTLAKDAWINTLRNK